MKHVVLGFRNRLKGGCSEKQKSGRKEKKKSGRKEKKIREKRETGKGAGEVEADGYQNQSHQHPEPPKKPPGSARPAPQGWAQRGDGASQHLPQGPPGRPSAPGVPPGDGDSGDGDTAGASPGWVGGPVGSLWGPHPHPAVWGLAGSQLSACSWLPAAVEHAEQPPEPFFLPALS